MAPAGGYGATICAHSAAGVLTTPCPLGPASRMPSSRASATSARSPSRPPSPAPPPPPPPPRLAVAGAGDERRRDPATRARAQELGVRAGGRAHEREVDG